MKRINYLFIASVILLSACAGGFKKGEGGMEYKITKGPGGKKVTKGAMIQINYRNQIKDTVFSSSDDNGPQVFMIDSARMPKMYFQMFTSVNVGDSVTMRMTSDTFFHGQFPPYAKKGQTVYSSFKVTSLFETSQAFDSAAEVAQRRGQDMKLKQYLAQVVKDSIASIPQLKADSKLIEDYLAKNHITAVKGKWGTYVQVLTPGTGALLDTGQVVKINYTGRNMGGVPFDSNVLDSFGAKEPLMLQIPANIHLARVIPGWIDGLKLLAKGSKAKFFIPSPLGYGKQGSEGKILPNEVLMFDIEVVDVLTLEQAMQESMAKQKAQMDAQSKMQGTQPQQQAPSKPK